MFLFVSFFACSENTDDTGGSGGSGLDFVGMDFVLESTEGYDLVADGARLSFASESEFSFSAGCNSLGGTYSVENDVFSLSEAFMTEMGCENALMEEDSWFVSFCSVLNF